MRLDGKPETEVSAFAKDGTMNFRNGRIYFWGAVQLNRVLQKVKNKKKTKNILIIQLKNKFLYNENGISTHFTPVEYLS